MNENASNESAFAEEDISAFDTGWDDEAPDYAKTTDEAEDAGEPKDSDAADDTGAGEDQPDAGDDKAEESKEEPAQAETFDLKYMGQQTSVGRNEVIRLAQMGMDYDRIRQDRDGMATELEGLRADKTKLEEYEGFLQELARSAGIDIPTLMDSTRAKALVAEEARRGNEISEDFAMQRIRFEREKADFEKQKTAGTAKKNEDSQPQAQEKSQESDAAAIAKARRDDEANAFLSAYPDIDPKTIPQEVLDKWMNGEPLLNAYMSYENKKLKADLAALEQNNKNSERSTGSAKSAGAGKTKDAFDIGWDSV